MNSRIPSVLRIHKLATIHASSMPRRLGALEPVVSTLVAMNLRALLFEKQEIRRYRGMAGTVA